MQEAPDHLDYPDTTQASRHPDLHHLLLRVQAHTLAARERAPTAPIAQHLASLEARVHAHTRSARAAPPLLDTSAASLRARLLHLPPAPGISFSAAAAHHASAAAASAAPLPSAPPEPLESDYFFAPTPRAEVLLTLAASREVLEAWQEMQQQ